MKMTRRIRHTRLGGALADRMMRIKRSTPVDQEIAAADLTLSPPRADTGMPDLVSLAQGYYRGHRAVIHSALAGLLLVALAGWAKHRRLI